MIIVNVENALKSHWLKQLDQCSMVYKTYPMQIPFTLLKLGRQNIDIGGYSYSQSNSLE